MFILSMFFFFPFSLTSSFFVRQRRSKLIFSCSEQPHQDAYRWNGIRHSSSSCVYVVQLFVQPFVDLFVASCHACAVDGFFPGLPRSDHDRRLRGSCIRQNLGGVPLGLGRSSQLRCIPGTGDWESRATSMASFLPRVS